MDGLTKPEEQMLLRALREYSEACEAPELTPHCPFAVDIEPNVRGCGEECMDLLGRYSAPRPERKIVLESGIVAHVPVRPRARRSARATLKPFDAKEIYLSDEETRDISDWHLPALLYGVVEVATSKPPPDDEVEESKRIEKINGMIQGIESHSLSFSTMVEPEIRFKIVGSMISETFRVIDHSDKSLRHRLSSWLPTIRARLDGLNSHSHEWHKRIVDTVLPSLNAWSVSAPFHEIVNWSLPSTLSEPQVPTAPPMQTPEGQWIIDRFVRTYLSRWRTESLRLEWRYIHGELDSPCSRSDMRAREVNEDELAKVMADRLAHHGDVNLSLAERLKPSAIGYLKEGAHDRAAILFEAIIQQEPDEAESHNNLGFCLMPTDPDQALVSLDKAMSLGWSRAPLTDANRILAVACAGRLQSALDLAQTFLLRHSRSDCQGGHFLWNPSSIIDHKEVELVESDDLYAYVETIVAALNDQLASNDAPKNEYRGTS